MVLGGAAILTALFFALKPKPVNNVNTVINTETSNTNTTGTTPNTNKVFTELFRLTVSGKKLTTGPETLRVFQGETVVIKITSDEAEELHLHGYDRSVELQPNQEAELTFVATLTGRFEYELERSGTALGVLEVVPR